ncbi:unnamed protein product, partial [Rotaria magnacalcarata]
NSSSEKENNVPIETKQDENNDNDDYEDDNEDDKSQPSEDESKDDLTKNKEMNDLATAAQALQPTGFTLNTTEVKTPVPFL